MSERHFCKDGSLRDSKRHSCPDCGNLEPKNRYRGKGKYEFIQDLDSPLPENAGSNDYWKDPWV